MGLFLDNAYSISRSQLRLLADTPETKNKTRSQC